MRGGPAILLAALALAACGETPLPEGRAVPGGDAEVGRRLILDHGCGACHVIPGVRGASGAVGPPLNGLARRTYIAGSHPNRPEVMVRWLLDPPSLAPDTAMPATPVDEQGARHIAAYLYTLTSLGVWTSW